MHHCTLRWPRTPRHTCTQVTPPPRTHLGGREDAGDDGQEQGEGGQVHGRLCGGDKKQVLWRKKCGFLAARHPPSPRTPWPPIPPTRTQWMDAPGSEPGMGPCTARGSPGRWARGPRGRICGRARGTIAHLCAHRHASRTRTIGRAGRRELESSHRPARHIVLEHSLWEEVGGGAHARGRTLTFFLKRRNCVNRKRFEIPEGCLD